MFSFGLQSLLYLGLPLLAVPIVIHLINLMRHRRIEWAAMEFLLESQKRNSRWIILKQLLLLLLRMGAVALVVLMLAQTELRNELGELLGGTRLHHVVLLDDTLSMSDLSGDGRAFQRAKDALKRLGADAADQSVPQRFTVLTYSAAARDAGPLLREVPVNRDRFITELEGALESLVTTALRVTPVAAMEALQRSLGEPTGEQRVLYVMSDFRRNDWDEPGELLNVLKHLQEQDTQVRLIDCAERSQPNLAITELVPLGGTRVAGVPVEMQLTVKNFGDAPATNVAVKLQVAGRDDRLSFDVIAPGASETQKFEVRFPSAGDHAVTARIDRPDVVEADQARHCALRVHLAEPVLIIDADPEGRDAGFLSDAFNPGGTVATGLAPRVEPPEFLERQSLDGFRAIYIVNLEHLQPDGLTRLEEFVRHGGGLGMFLGKLTSVRFLREKLYRDGQGVFPAPIPGATDLLLDQLEKTPDLQVQRHRVFRIFAGERNSYLQTVLIRRYFEVDRSWQPPPESRMQVLATLRNGSPFAIEQPYGKGRVVAILTTAAPDWNNWATNPSFPVVMHELQSYLTASHVETYSHLVGAPIDQTVEAARYQDKARFLKPGEEEPNTVPMDFPADGDVRPIRLTDTLEPGVYALRLTTAEGELETRQFAFNVDPEEGNLAKLDGQALVQRLPGVNFQYQSAGQFNFGAELAGFNLTDSFLYLLVVLLLGEQALAYLFSYHPAAKGRGA